MNHTPHFLALAAFALSAQAVEYPRDEIILHGASEHFKARNKTKVRQQATPYIPGIAATPGTPAIEGRPAIPATPAVPAIPAVPPIIKHGKVIKPGTPAVPAVSANPGSPAVEGRPATPGTPAVAATPGTPAVIDRIGWNETNYGLGWRHAYSQDWSLQGGIYKDSRSRASAYVTGDYTPFGTKWLRVGGFAAMRVTNDGFGPAAGGLARLQFERWSLAARIWPTVGRYSGGVAIEAGFRFN